MGQPLGRKAVSRPSHRLDDVDCGHGYDPRRIDGTIWGGNLSLLAHLVGTPYFLWLLHYTRRTQGGWG